MLALWCVYLISLLATTVCYLRRHMCNFKTVNCYMFVKVDNFFVPPLIFLSEKLKLSPSIAGITLLALGNGA